jgi:hypothetical protein
MGLHLVQLLCSSPSKREDISITVKLSTLKDMYLINNMYSIVMFGMKRINNVAPPEPVEDARLSEDTRLGPTSRSTPDAIVSIRETPGWRTRWVGLGVDPLGGLVGRALLGPGPTRAAS